MLLHCLSAGELTNLPALFYMHGSTGRPCLERAAIRGQEESSVIPTWAEQCQAPQVILFPQLPSRAGASSSLVSDNFGHGNHVNLRDYGNEPCTTVSAFRAVCRGTATLNAPNREIAQLGSTPVRAADFRSFVPRGSADPSSLFFGCFT